MARVTAAANATNIAPWKLVVANLPQCLQPAIDHCGGCTQWPYLQGRQ
jgi:hypothetical protein